jgi:hypothetical protein
MSTRTPQWIVGGHTYTNRVIFEEKGLVRIVSAVIKCVMIMGANVWFENRAGSVQIGNTLESSGCSSQMQIQSNQLSKTNSCNDSPGRRDSGASLSKHLMHSDRRHQFVFEILDVSVDPDDVDNSASSPCSFGSVNLNVLGSVSGILSSAMTSALSFNKESNDPTRTLKQQQSALKTRPSNYQPENSTKQLI